MTRSTSRPYLFSFFSPGSSCGIFQYESVAEEAPRDLAGHTMRQTGAINKHRRPAFPIFPSFFFFLVFPPSPFPPEETGLRLRSSRPFKLSGEVIKAQSARLRLALSLFSLFSSGDGRKQDFALLSFASSGICWCSSSLFSFSLFLLYLYDYCVGHRVPVGVTSRRPGTNAVCELFLFSFSFFFPLFAGWNLRSFEGTHFNASSGSLVSR